MRTKSAADVTFRYLTIQTGNVRFKLPNEANSISFSVAASSDIGHSNIPLFSSSFRQHLIILLKILLTKWQKLSPAVSITNLCWCTNLMVWWIVITHAMWTSAVKGSWDLSTTQSINTNSTDDLVSLIIKKCVNFC